ncbi:hypothetical protein ACFV6E_41645 [Streptomyces sp. NPDC059785]|uniref:hypothetical protein n=1 Tax=unclassified Streptomyces TaxID=2593676 RepID=UPI0036524014
MATAQPESTPPNNSAATPDDLLHTGADGEVTAEDLVLAAGRDVNPESLAWAERKLAEEGPAALHKLLP